MLNKKKTSLLTCKKLAFNAANPRGVPDYPAYYRLALHGINFSSSKSQKPCNARLLANPRGVEPLTF